MEIVALVNAARGGDQAAFGRIVAEYERPVHSLCYRMLGNPKDAEDASQETFLRAFRALDRYDSRRPFSSWLLSIAAHHCIDRLRRRRMSVVSLDALPPWRWIPGGAVDPEESVERVDQADRIGSLLMTLSADYRLVIVLRYWHDLGYSEIAEMLGDTESAVKSRLHRARKQLADALESPERGSALRPEGAVPTKRTDEGGMAWSVTQPAAG